MSGTVYLLHYARPIRGGMRHYLGWTNDLETRIWSHREGGGSVTTKLFFEQGVGFELARTWPGDQRRERALKRRPSRTLCPICSAAERGG